MEFFLFMSLLVSLTIFIYFNFIHKTKTQPATTTMNPTNEKLPLPPGNTGWPLIGETIDYISKMKNGVCRDFVMERIKKYSSNVFKTSLLGHPTTILYGVEGNKFLFTNEQKLVQVWYPAPIRDLVMKSLSNNNYEGMKMQRKRFAPFLNGEGLHRFIGKMDTVMREHLETSWDCEEVYVSVAVKKYTLQQTLWYFLSFNDTKKIEKISLQFDDLVAGISSIPINFPGTTFHRANKASQLIIEDLKCIIKQRKIDLLEKTATPTQDALNHMLLATDENGQFLKEFDIAFSFQSMILGSFESMSTVLTFTMKYLAELPEVYHEVLREQMEIAKSKESDKLLNWDDLRKMRYSWNVVCEVMRLQLRGGTFREAITDFTYDGYSIPKGWKLHWLADLTHRNPEYFPNPDKFDPSRFAGTGPTPYAFVPFGGGARMCPGTEYAKVAILVFMHNIVTKFSWEILNPNEKVIIPGVFPKCSQGLPIRLYPHKP